MNHPYSKHMMSTMTEERFSIRQLSEISGVNAVTLRAWERRYGLLKPSRTDKGHRYYTTDDVERVRNIVNWLDRGLAISKVRPLLDGENNSTEIEANTGNHWQETISLSLAFINHFQREKLEQLINELFGNYPLDNLAVNYFHPMRETLDRQAKLRFGGAAEKIFFDSELHADLLARIRHANNNNHGEHILLVALDGNRHGIDALLLALALLESGLRLHLLLDACNLREIPFVIAQSQLHPSNSIKAVICHSDSKQDVLLLEQELARAASHARVPFFLSGEWMAITPSLKHIDGITTLDRTMRAAVSTITKSLGKPA
jgi:DNA-binding transcriptional MerR regulator